MTALFSLYTKLLLAMQLRLHAQLPSIVNTVVSAYNRAPLECALECLAKSVEVFGKSMPDAFGDVLVVVANTTFARALGMGDLLGTGTAQVVIADITEFSSAGSIYVYQTDGSPSTSLHRATRAGGQLVLTSSQQVIPGSNKQGLWLQMRRNGAFAGRGTSWRIIR